MKTTIRESDILKQCLDYLALRGIPAWRSNSGAVVAEHKGKRRFVQFNSAKGCSDILAILPPHGRLLTIEVKRPGGKLTADQQAFLDAVNAAGGCGIVITDVSELAKFLEAGDV